MAGTYGKSILGSCLMLVLISGIKAQAPASGALKGETASTPQTAVPAPSQNAEGLNQNQKPALVYESATVLKSITRLVVVDVVATGKDGAVTDLQRDDFTVFEDGKEQKVRVFNFQQPRVNTSGSAPIVPPKLP